MNHSLIHKPLTFFNDKVWHLLFKTTKFKKSFLIFFHYCPKYFSKTDKCERKKKAEFPTFFAG
jgi:hypothetical protein